MNRKLKAILVISASLLVLIGIGSGMTTAYGSYRVRPVYRNRVSRWSERRIGYGNDRRPIYRRSLVAKRNPRFTERNYRLTNQINRRPVIHHRYYQDPKPAKSYRTYDLVRYAKSQIGKHHYSEGMGVSKDSRNGMLYHPRNGRADCASFVYFVYRHCGYKVPPFYGNAWAKEGSVVGPKRVRARQTIPGSIVQNPIHMVLLEEKYHGPKTRIIEEGGYWNGGNKYRRNVNEGSLGGAFTPMDRHYIFYNPVKAR